MGEAATGTGAAAREARRQKFAEQHLSQALNGVTLALEGHGFELTSGPIIARSEHFEITITQREVEPRSNIIVPAPFGGGR